MTASPDQRLTADARRGYSKAYLNQVCVCGCTRAAHKDHSGACVCDCQVFSMSVVQPAGAVPPEKTYMLGTLRLPNEHPPQPQALVAGEEPIVILEPAPIIPREGTATRCPFCLADDFGEVPAVKCPTCKAWQHADCVREAGYCAACGTSWP